MHGALLVTEISRQDQNFRIIPRIFFAETIFKEQRRNFIDHEIFICWLVDLILYVPVNIFTSVILGRYSLVEQVIKQG